MSLVLIIRCDNCNVMVCDRKSTQENPYSAIIPAYPMLMEANETTDLSEATSPTGMMFNGVALFRYADILCSQTCCVRSRRNSNVILAWRNNSCQTGRVYELF